MICSNDFTLDVGASCRTLDFTIGFESLYFAVLTSAVFIALVIGHYGMSTPHHDLHKVRNQRLKTIKAVLSTSVIVADLIVLARAPPVGDWLIAAASATLIASLSHAAVHLHRLLGKKEASTVLTTSIYLLLLAVFDAARLRTFSLAGISSAERLLYVAFASSYGIKLLLLIADNIPDSTDTETTLAETLLLWRSWPPFVLARRRSLRLVDLKNNADDSAGLYRQWVTHYDACRQRRAGLARSFISAFPTRCATPLLAGLVMTGGFLCEPLQLRALLRFLASWSTPGQTPEPVAYGWALTASYGISTSLVGFGTSTMLVSVAKLAVIVRAVLCEAIYRKIVCSPVFWPETNSLYIFMQLRLHLTVAQDIGAGAMQSFITVDIERIVSAVDMPFRIVLLVLLHWPLALVIMSTVLKGVVLAPTLVFIGSLVFLPVINTIFSCDSTRWSAATDRRTKLISSILSSIKAIKLGGYEAAFARHYNDLREAELAEFKRYRFLFCRNGWALNIWWAAIRVAMLMSFAIYCKLGGSACASAAAFPWRPARSLVTALTLQLVTYAAVFVLFAALECTANATFTVIWRYGLMVSAWASLKRIERFLDATENTGLLQSTGDDGSETIEKRDPIPRFDFTNATLGYNGGPTLHDITAACPAGQLTMVVGPVACGKTSFLNALLGEIDVQKGDARYQPAGRPRIAYCSQDPVLLPGSIRRNVLLGLDLDRDRYERALRSAALDVDIEVLDDGDDHPASSLSGGQRHRVTLARAIYEDAEVVILDDVLSAVDHTTEKLLFKALFDNDVGVLRGKTVVMSSNDEKRFRHADQLVVLDKGRIEYCGPPAGFLPEKALETGFRSSRTLSESHLASPLIRKERLEKAATSRQDSVEVENEASDSSLESAFTSLKRHFASASLWYNILWAVSAPAFTFGYLSEIPLYSKFWTQSSTALSALGAWLGGLVAQALLNILVGYFYFAVAQTWHPLSSFRSLHRTMVSGTLSAPMSFFSHYSSAFLLNRFSSDVMLAETELVESLQGLGDNSTMLFAPLIITIVAIPWSALAVAALFALTLLVRAIYIPTSKQLRALESASKTPLYDATSQISHPEGLKLARAYARHEQMHASASSAITQANTPYFALAVARQLVSLVLYLGCAPVSVVLVGVAVVKRSDSNGLFAVALISAIVLSEIVRRLIFAVTECEIASVALARMHWLADQTAEEGDVDLSKPLDKEDKTWLAEGSIAYERVSMRYGPELPLVVKDVSFSFPAGTRVGICGRTGSGKTTLLSLLFRLADLESGMITSKAGGHDITTMTRQKLRSALCAIPQDPLLVDLPLRNNIDPSGKATDDEIWLALERTACKPFVEQLEGGLDHEVVVNGGAFSRGTRQLIALTRALLQKPKLLALDEASSSLDVQTDDAIQETLRSGFGRDTTLLVVAHRISTIRDMDVILVMDGGRIVEQGPPGELLEREDGIFRSLAGEDPL